MDELRIKALVSLLAMKGIITMEEYNEAFQATLKYEENKMTDKEKRHMKLFSELFGGDFNEII